MELIEVYKNLADDVNIINFKFNEAVNESKDLEDFYIKFNEKMLEATTEINQKIVDELLKGLDE